MSRLVEISYDPYNKKSSILIDGNPLPEFSQLVQYTDEDVWEFGSEIFNALDSELREDYIVSFQGRPEDAELLRLEAVKAQGCKGFKAKDFIVNDNLQKRLGSLNQLIKRIGKSSINPVTIYAEFIVSPDLSELNPYLKSLDIKNLYTTVIPEVNDTPSTVSNIKGNKYFFIINNDLNNALKIAKTIPNDSFVFIIIVGSNKGLIQTDRNIYVYETAFNDVITTVFSCLLNIPLLLAFRSVINNLSPDLKKSRQVERILATKPIIDIRFNKSIELGRSNKINISYDPKVATPPPIEYKIMDDSIATVSNNLIVGKKSGSTTMEVYRVGEKEPFVTFPIDVYKRNRIMSLTLSDYELRLGEGDNYNLRYEFFPKDADNIQTIAWESTDNDIISVNNGQLKAKRPGSCRIICTAENISTQCQCEVLPYLKSITTDISLGEDGIVHMEPAQEIPVHITLTPTKSFDGNITVDSDDYDVVNIVNGVLVAKAPGTAKITIKNNTGRKSLTIPVQVKKKGFFASLFGK